MSTNQTKEWLSQQQIRQFFSQNKKEWFDSNFEIEHLLQHGSIEKTAIYLNDKHQDDTGYALVQADAEAFVAYLAAAKVESRLSMIDSDYHDNDLPKVIVMLNNYDIEKFSNLVELSYFVRNDDLDFSPERGVTIQAFASLKEAVADKLESIDAYHGTYAGIEDSLVIYTTPRSMANASLRVPFTIEASPVPLTQIAPLEAEYRTELAAKVDPLYGLEENNNSIIIRGDNTELTVDLDNGAIIDGESDLEITHFDIKELKAWCADELGEDVSPGDEFDILSIGYWTADGKHTAPEVDYRDEIKSSRCRP